MLVQSWLCWGKTEARLRGDALFRCAFYPSPAKDSAVARLELGEPFKVRVQVGHRFFDALASQHQGSHVAAVGQSLGEVVRYLLEPAQDAALTAEVSTNAVQVGHENSLSFIGGDLYGRLASERL